MPLAVAASQLGGSGAVLNKFTQFMVQYCQKPVENLTTVSALFINSYTPLCRQI
jgi:hypothetical protein